MAVRSRVRRLIDRLPPASRGIVTQTKAQSLRENEFCNSSVKLLPTPPDAKWYQPFMKWDRSVPAEITGKRFLRLLQTPSSPPERGLRSFSCCCPIPPRNWRTVFSGGRVRFERVKEIVRFCICLFFFFFLSFRMARGIFLHRRTLHCIVFYY